MMLWLFQTTVCSYTAGERKRGIGTWRKFTALCSRDAHADHVIFKQR